MYHLTRRRQGQRMLALPCSETPRRPRYADGITAQRAAALPLPFGPYFACHSEKEKKRKEKAGSAIGAACFLIFSLESAAVSIGIEGIKVIGVKHVVHLNQIPA